MRHIFIVFLQALGVALFLQACGGDGNVFEPKEKVLIDTVTAIVTPIASENQAGAFLASATFGVQKEDITELQSMGNYEAWITNQASLVPTYLLDNLTDRLYVKENWSEADKDSGSPAVFSARRAAWLDNSVNAKDQLRQRVAFALSELMVLSDLGPLTGNYDDGIASYYDVLVRNSLGNFRTLLDEVTKHPMMGLFLGITGNAKADPTKGNHADENYAREVMQLFTIGLDNLNIDGSSKGTPTYAQSDIENLAKVFTGWSANRKIFSNIPTSHQDRIHTMTIYEEHHDKNSKIVLGHSIPAGLFAQEDMQQALDIIFNHPNVGPFVSKHLILRLVTSNPSPQYIQRVATVFNDNGKGVRGDLLAVVKAILLDDEALKGRTLYPNSFGKLREPILRIPQLLRTFHATGDAIVVGGKTYQDYGYVRSSQLRQEAALNSTTVFNYFSPIFKPQGTNLVAPEFQILSELDLAAQNDFMIKIARENGSPTNVSLNYTTEVGLVPNPTQLVKRLDLLLMAGAMSKTMKDTLVNYIQVNTTVAPDILVKDCVSLIITSAEYAIQR